MWTWNCDVLPSTLKKNISRDNHIHDVSMKTFPSAFLFNPIKSDTCSFYSINLCIADDVAVPRNKQKKKSNHILEKKKKSKQNSQINFNITINKFIFPSFQTPRIKCNQQKNRLHDFFFSAKIGRPLTHLKKKSGTFPVPVVKMQEEKKRDILW